MFLLSGPKERWQSPEFREPTQADYTSAMVQATGELEFKDRDRVGNVVPLEGRSVHLFWRSGLDEIIDLKPVLVRFSRRPVAVRELLFRTVRPGPEGRSIIWDDGSEIGLSWLQDLALARMSSHEFRGALDGLGMTIEEAARHLGVSTRSIAGYRRDRPVPRAIALAVRYLLLRRQRTH